MPLPAHMAQSFGGENLEQ